MAPGHELWDGTIAFAAGHELWNGTIAFAAGCPWKAAAFLGQRRWSQTILKITKELLWPSFFQNAVTKKCCSRERVTAN